MIVFTLHYTTLLFCINIHHRSSISADTWNCLNHQNSVYHNFNYQYFNSLTMASQSVEFPTLEEIQEVATVMANWQHERLRDYRKMLFNDINGRHFKNLYWWPEHMVQSFWRKPMIQRDVFKLLCFFLGNGCHTRLALYWILTSAAWCPSELKHRCDRLHSFYRDLPQKIHIWFYYDLDKKRFLHLDGSVHDTYFF